MRKTLHRRQVIAGDEVILIPQRQIIGDMRVKRRKGREAEAVQTHMPEVV